MIDLQDAYNLDFTLHLRLTWYEQCYFMMLGVVQTNSSCMLMYDELHRQKKACTLLLHAVYNSTL